MISKEEIKSEIKRTLSIEAESINSLITDLDMDYLNDVETIASQHYNGRIEKHVINFYGICEECSALEEKTS